MNLPLPLGEGWGEGSFWPNHALITPTLDLTLALSYKEREHSFNHDNLNQH